MNPSRPPGTLQEARKKRLKKGAINGKGRLDPSRQTGEDPPVPTNIEKLDEQLSTLDSLRAAGIRFEISKVPGDPRIYFKLPFGHTAAYLEFAEILPYDPNGAPGTVTDLCEGNSIQVFADIRRLTRTQAKRIGPELYRYLYFILYDAACEGKITSKVMATTKFPPHVLRRREADLERIATEFEGSHEAFLQSLDPVAGRDSVIPPFSHEGVIDARARRRKRTT
jgi:hypothetical protein